MNLGIVKKIIFVLTITFIGSGCGIDSQQKDMEEKLSYKEWHVSPSSDPASSTSYPYVSWDEVNKIEVGMSEEEVEKIVKTLQYYHTSNAIVFSRSPEGVNHEVALKLSDKKEIMDISFLKLNN